VLPRPVTLELLIDPVYAEQSYYNRWTLQRILATECLSPYTSKFHRLPNICEDSESGALNKSHARHVRAPVVYSYAGAAVAAAVTVTAPLSEQNSRSEERRPHTPHHCSSIKQTRE
jgi:hypothetical protein